MGGRGVEDTVDDGRGGNQQSGMESEGTEAVIRIPFAVGEWNSPGVG